jgi:hypothetical protein
MVSTEPCHVASVDIPVRGRGSFVLAGKTGAYIFVLVAVALAAGMYGLRTYGIFSCQAARYSSDRYLSYCTATGYGDYDHGAIWFGLEPAARAAAANARILFLGNSRTQFGFSNQATEDWFRSLSEKYYLLGFSHDENYTFEMPLLKNLHPKAKVYVINVDSFFDGAETGPGRTVMRDESARGRYEEKRKWQRIHKAACTAWGAICGTQGAFFRSRATGAWLVSGGPFPRQAVSYDDDIDQNKVASYTAPGSAFIKSLSVDPACTVLTIIPTVKTGMGTARAVADALHRRLVAPRLAGLVTFDKVHLDPESSERWSAEFFAEAGPQIRKCLSQ